MDSIWLYYPLIQQQRSKTMIEETIGFEEYEAYEEFEDEFNKYDVNFIDYDLFEFDDVK